MLRKNKKDYARKDVTTIKIYLSLLRVNLKRLSEKTKKKLQW